MSDQSHSSPESSDGLNIQSLKLAASAAGVEPEETSFTSLENTLSPTRAEQQQFGDSQQQAPQKGNIKSRFQKILTPIRRSHSAGRKQEEEGGGAGKVEVERVNSDPPKACSQQPQSGDVTIKTESTETSAVGKCKNLAKDVKQKFSWLKRRHTEQTIPGGGSSSGGGSGQKGKNSGFGSGNVNALAWSTDIETLLQDKDGVEMFREFLQSEFSDENLEFWIACEEYKTLKPGQYKAAAKQVYDEFVAILAPREVNLDSKTRMQTKEILATADVHCFDNAQKRITTLMAKDSYRRFLDSDVYQNLVKSNT